MSNFGKILSCIALMASFSFAQNNEAFLQGFSDDMERAVQLNDSKKLSNLEKKFSTMSPIEQAKVRENLKNNPKAARVLAKSQISELGVQLKDYNDAQKAYVQTTGKMGTWPQAGFTAPQTENFNYTEVLYGIKAISKMDMADCPAHSIWKINATYNSKSKNVEYSCSVSGKNVKACEDLASQALKNYCK